MEEMTREEMQRFLELWHREGHSELECFRALMKIIGVTFPGVSRNDREGESDAAEIAE